MPARRRATPRRYPLPAGGEIVYTGTMTDVTPPAQSVMLGHGVYSHHSQPQRAAARVADELVVAAARDVPLPAAPSPMLVGDLGCAGGANEMRPMASVVDAVRVRDPALPVEVAHTDLPENDFGPLFELLAGPSGYPHGRAGVYPYVVGRSLYGPLFPDRRLHLGWSAITLHWLSSVPVTVPDTVYANLVEPGPVRDALADRSAADWRLFLSERARELVDDGELVLTAGASEPDGTSGAEGLFTLVEAQLTDMLRGGVLRPHEFEAIFYPTWNRTPDEWLAPIDDAGYELLAHNLSATDDAETFDAGHDPAFADRYLPFVRAITERPFFRWLDPARTPTERTTVVDAFYDGLRHRIAADPRAAACRWHVMTLRLRRRPRR